MSPTAMCRKFPEEPRRVADRDVSKIPRGTLPPPNYLRREGTPALPTQHE